MKYRDLIQFDPIVTVIELRSADDAAKARELVRSYVMSDAMADLVNGKILSQLNLEEVVDNKGVLLVGNYGTGKSHLMSVISAVAADATMLQEAQNERFRQMAGTIAGQFEVLRIEIGSTAMSLRDIVTGAIEKDLAKRGITFRFPDVTKVANNKDALNDMMAAFAAKYGKKGYLVIVDELLDYLKSRKDNELMQDINFMRELGEFIKSSRFRFISGVQEALFDNPTFHNVSNSLLKMKDRYEQALIRSQDIAYVAKQRVLHKTPEQKALIREHLLPFCKLYSGMAEQLEEYVDLFPIHPAYIHTFQRMIIVEKREVLKTISETIGEIINADVPAHEPGIVSYDSYWQRIQNDPGKRVEPAVAEVLQKSGVLEDIVRRSFVKAAYRPTALKIIAALSVHRLTTATLEAKLGLTAENLKDELCIFLPIPQMDAAFLLSTVQSVLRDIMTTVSGQFIEYNKENEQYYLDLKKDVDYDKKIQEKADFLGDDRLNGYFFGLIWDCLDWHPEQYKSGHQIYQYNIVWQDKNHFRRGYLFMGTSSERPTAQPPEDFYAYFLPPYGKLPKGEPPEEDEVYFIFQHDPKFTQMLRTYAGACEMESISSQGETKAAYTQRAKTVSRSIRKYMEEHSTTAFKVSYCGTEKPMLSYLQGVRMDTLTIKSAIDTCVSRALSAYFGSHYPDFPRFRSPITQENQANIRIAAMEVLGGKPQKLGIETLEALGLMLNGKIKPENSPYATYYIQMLSKLPEGSVLNYADIMQPVSDGIAAVDKKYLLTDMLMSLVLSALVYGGFCVMVADNNLRYDASNVSDLVSANPLDLFRFKRLEKPKAAPVLRLRRLFAALGVNDGLIMNAGTWDTAVEELIKRTKELSDLVFHFGSFLDKSTYLWGDSIIPTNRADQFRQETQPLKKLYDDIRSRFNSAAKLKNFDYDDTQLAAVEKAVEAVGVLKGIETFKSSVGDIMQYLSSAEMKVEEGTTLRAKFVKQKEAYLDMRAELLSPDYDEVHTDDLMDVLEALKKEYIDYYMQQHKACRLGIKDAQRRQKILDGMTVYKLKILAQLTGILTTGKYNDLVSHQLADIKVCYECTGTEMQSHVECPHCGFVPASKESVVAGRLDVIESKLEEMLENWRETLLDMLANDPMIVDRKRYMSAELQPIITVFIENKRFPDDLNSFVRAVREAFADYECVEMDEDAFMEEVLSWGTLSPDAFKKRMGDYVDKLVGKRNKDQVRLAFCDGHQVDA